MYGKGISHEGEILDIGVSYGIIQKSGAWFSYNDQRLGQGRDNVKIFFEQNPELTAEIEAKIRERLTAENAAKRNVSSVVQAAQIPVENVVQKKKSVAANRAILDITVDD
jgi:recombination protein RecA